MVKRYEVGWDEQPYEDPNGPYVLYGDYKKLEDKVKSSEMTVEELHSFFDTVE